MRSTRKRCRRDNRCNRCEPFLWHALSVHPSKRGRKRSRKICDPHLPAIARGTALTLAMHPPQASGSHESKEKRQRGDAQNAEGSRRVRNGLAFAVHGWRISESKLHGTEKREKRAARVDVFETLSGLQRGSAAREHDVFGQRRAVLDADAKVFTDRVVNGRLEQEKFERLGAFETQKIKIRKASQFGSDLKVRAGVGEKNPGVDEIGLAFFLAGAQRGNEAAGSGQQNAGSEKPNAFTIPEAEQPAGKIGQIDDGVESAGASVARIRVAGSVESGNAVTDPVFVV